MAKTELQQLVSHIRTVQGWTNAQSVYALLDTFISLNELDRQANPEKWAELREELAINKELDDSAVRKFLTDKSFSRKGYWWWNPKNWKE